MRSSDGNNGEGGESRKDPEIDLEFGSTPTEGKQSAMNPLDARMHVIDSIAALEICADKIEWAGEGAIWENSQILKKGSNEAMKSPAQREIIHFLPAFILQLALGEAKDNIATVKKNMREIFNKNENAQVIMELPAVPGAPAETVTLEARSRFDQTFQKFLETLGKMKSRAQQDLGSVEQAAKIRGQQILQEASEQRRLRRLRGVTSPAPRPQEQSRAVTSPAPRPQEQSNAQSAEGSFLAPLKLKRGTSSSLAVQRIKSGSPLPGAGPQKLRPASPFAGTSSQGGQRDAKLPTFGTGQPQGPQPQPQPQRPRPASPFSRPAPGEPVVAKLPIIGGGQPSTQHPASPKPGELPANDPGSPNLSLPQRPAVLSRTGSRASRAVVEQNPKARPGIDEQGTLLPAPAKRTPSGGPGKGPQSGS